MSEELHPLTSDLVDRFATALKEKLLVSQIKYGWTDDWARDDWEERCQASLLEHLQKGDPRDVAAFAAFMWHHEWNSRAALKDRDVVLEEAAERAAFVAGYRAAHMVPDAYDSTSAAEEAWEGYRLVSRALKERV